MMKNKADLVFEGALALEKGTEEFSKLIKYALESQIFLSIATPVIDRTSSEEKAKLKDHDSVKNGMVCAIQGDNGPYPYPFAKMMRGIACCMDGSHSMALGYLAGARRMGLDNVLLHITNFMIHLSSGDTVKANEALTVIDRKVDDAKLLGVLEHLIANRSGKEQVPLNPIRLYVDNLEGGYYPTVSINAKVDSTLSGIRADGINNVKKGATERLKKNSPASYGMEAFLLMSQRMDLLGQSDKILESALVLVNRAIKGNKDYAWGYWLRAWVLYEKKQFNAALEDINLAITLGLINVFCLRLKAAIHLELKEFEKTLNDVEQALQYTQHPVAVAHTLYYKLIAESSIGEN